MTPTRAHKILLAWGLTTCSPVELHDLAVYVSVWADRKLAILDGGFTADELEAVATWMRDPVAVMGPTAEVSGGDPLHP